MRNLPQEFFWDAMPPWPPFSAKLTGWSENTVQASGKVGQAMSLTSSLALPISGFQAKPARPSQYLDRSITSMQLRMLLICMWFCSCPQTSCCVTCVCKKKSEQKRKFVLFFFSVLRTVLIICRSMTSIWCYGPLKMVLFDFIFFTFKGSDTHSHPS